ncbi:hypothetical protein [Treponema sp. R6D11]
MELIDKYIKIRYINLMGTKRGLFIFSLAVIAVITAFSCKSDSETVKGNTGTHSNKTEAFDPTKVSQAKYVSTRDEVQKFIEQQNKFIRERNFDAWRSSLSDEYFAEISSKENLKRISDQPAMKTRRIVLRTAQDYFDYVVVPSRADLRVDEIEFISENRVKAFTMITNKAGEEQRLRLYDLEKIDNSWTIIN